MSRKEVKCVVVGDGCVGKTCLLYRYTEGTFPTEYVPTVFDNFEGITEINGKEVNFSLWDTAGQESYKRIRCLSYPNTDIFIVCFSVADPVTFANISDRWLPEIRHHAKTSNFLFVGTKSDLRSNEKEAQRLHQIGYDFVSEEAATTLAKSLGANYLECSAFSDTGVKQVFSTALNVALGLSTPSKKSKKANKHCNLL